MVVAAVLATLSTLLFFGPFFEHWANWGIEDWDYWAAHHEVARRTLLEYGQLPQWNPWMCGGTDFAAHPGSRIFAPSAPLILWLGATAGMKVEIILHAILGQLGLYALGRQLGLDRASAWFAPVTLFLGSFYALPISAGIIWYTTVAFVPWSFLFFSRALTGDFRCLLAASLCLALMFFGGGVYPLAITGAFLGLHASLGVREFGVRRIGAALGGLAATALGLSAVKALPAIEFMRDFPRAPDQPTGFSLEGIAISLFSRDQRLEVAVTHFQDFAPGQFWRGISADFDDMGMYVGPVVAALFCVGLIARGRQHWKLVVTLVAFLALSFGDRLAWGPFQMIRELPVFGAMRYAERYRLVWLPCALLIAGAGSQWIRAGFGRRFPGRRVGDAVAVAALLVVLADLFVVTRPIYQGAFPIAPMRLVPFPSFRQIFGMPNYDARGFLPKPHGRMLVYGSHSAHYPAFLRDAGFVACYESAPVPRRAIPARAYGYRGEVHLRGTAGSVETISWSPNELRYRVRAASNGRLIVNQNFDRGWAASDGRPVYAVDGLIAVAVAPGDSEIDLSYSRRTLAPAAVVSGVSGLAALLALRRESRRRKLSAGQ